MLTLKTYDPESGVVLKFKTDRAADVGRLVAGLGLLGRHMAALPEKRGGENFFPPDGMSKGNLAHIQQWKTLLWKMSHRWKSQKGAVQCQRQKLKRRGKTQVGAVGRKRRRARSESDVRDPCVPRPKLRASCPEWM